MLRVLHSVSNMDRGGIETMLMNYYRHIDREKVQFDFIVNKQKPGDYDDEIRRLGGHIYQSPGLNPLHYPAYLRYNPSNSDHNSKTNGKNNHCINFFTEIKIFYVRQTTADHKID